MKKNWIVFTAIITLSFLLRVYKISSFPPGLYSDEAAYGYNAFSLLKTGRDEYGKYWPLTFKNFGDYKPPMTAWLTIPAIAAFGLNEFAIRLPSILAGTITVAIVFFLAKEIFPNQKKFSIFRFSRGTGSSAKPVQFSTPEVAALLLAISPWHLQFSRSSMLVSIEALFVSLGLLLFLKGLKKPKLLFLSAVSFTAAIYTYYGSRVTVALMLISLVILFKDKLWKIRSSVIASAILATLLLSPLIFAIIKSPTTLTGRARTISIFYDPGIRAKLWEAHTLDGENFPKNLSRFFHNKPYFYARDIARRYFQHMSYNFWVRTGDTTPPFDIPNMGVVYLADLAFVFYGFYLAIRYKTKKSLALLVYLLVSPVAAAFTFITPASNRAFNMIVGWTILTGLGITTVMQYIRKRFSQQKSALIGLSVIYLISVGFYLYNYYVTTPLQLPHNWHYGRKQLIQKVSALESQYKRVIFSNKEGPAYIWLLFYKQYDPQRYWRTAKVDETLNELGWLHIEAFDKYVFPREFSWESVEKAPNTLYVGYEEQIPDSWTDKLDGVSYSVVIDNKILYPNGSTAFKIVHLEAI